MKVDQKKLFVSPGEAEINYSQVGSLLAEEVSGYKRGHYLIFLKLSSYMDHSCWVSEQLNLLRFMILSFSSSSLCCCKIFFAVLLVKSIVACCHPVLADAIKIAVAANFSAPALKIGQAYRESTGHAAVFIFGSTGQLYAQILQGAPYDAFLSADQEHPKKIIEAGYAKRDSRFTYAKGRLAVYSRVLRHTNIKKMLIDHSLDRIAIANPDIAPYGAASLQTMKALGIYGRLLPSLIKGMSISHAYHFVESGNASAGFVAVSQIQGLNTGSVWIVPAYLHDPILQDAVILNKGPIQSETHSFIKFLRAPVSQSIITHYGYDPGN